MPATLAWMIPLRDARRRHSARFAVDKFEFLSAAIAWPIEKFFNGHSRGSEFG
jgi:hypothetical protein